MKLSTDRILTTHTGSLPRPQPLIDLVLRKEKGEAIEAAMFEAETAKAVDGIVAQQIAAGVDVVSDGEMSKPSYTTYIRHRVTGIAQDPRAAEKGRDIMIGRDMLAHPDFARGRNNFSTMPFPGCVGPLTYKDREPLERDLAHLAVAAGKQKPIDMFMTAPSPGILTRFIINLYYPNEDAYVAALADVMRTEYQAIVNAGFVLQIDRPDLGSCRNNQYRDLTDDNSAKLPSATSRLSTQRPKVFLPTRCGCTFAGAITRGRTASTCRCLRSSTSHLRGDHKRSASRPLIRGTIMNGKTSRRSKSLMTRC